MKLAPQLIIISLLFCTATAGAQSTVSLPDPTGKVSYISGRDPQPATAVPSLSGDPPNEPPVTGPADLSEQPQTGDPDQRMHWWREARFGLFIHWGLYAVPAGEWKGKNTYGEWIRHSARIPLEVYDRFRTEFNPVKFDADAWVQMARDAGMKYIVITSKHHDGFCMFDTKQTDFDIMNTPFGRDPMKELAKACEKYGLKFCFYHSIMDWHHPDYLPRRDWETNRSVEGADFGRYIGYMKAELNELLTGYGKLGVLWFDGEWENTWNEKYGKEIYHYVRSLQSGILVNNRVGAGRLDMEGLTREGAFGGDFGTPEQQIPATGLSGVDWETCMTMNDHWGYNKADKNFKSSREMIRMLADIASKGGNYLLNVGPDAQGLIPPESVERLQDIGRWMKVNGESIHGTTASPFRNLAWGRCTQKPIPGGTRLYLHVFEWPSTGELILPGLLNRPLFAGLLGYPGALKYERRDDAIVIALPGRCPDPDDAVVVLDIAGKPDLTEPPDFRTSFSVFTDSLKVELGSDRERVEIRYELGQKEPTTVSPLYAGPLTLHGTTVISARCFREGKPVSGTATREFVRVMPEKAVVLPAGHDPVSGLHMKYYEVTLDSLPVPAALKPVKVGVVAGIGLSQKNRPDLFSFRFSGYIRIPETSVYAFELSSDDGSILQIGGKTVVNNNGLHGMQGKQGVVALERGYHPIVVDYFERDGSDDLRLEVKSPVMERKTVPAEWYFTD